MILGLVYGCVGSSESEFSLISPLQPGIGPEVFSASTTGSFLGADPVRVEHLVEVGTISAARVPDDTTILVVDGMACQVVAFTVRFPDRYEVRNRFGACGDGPGEFRDLADGYLHGDSLFALDNWTQRISVFPVEGPRPAVGREFAIHAQDGSQWRPLEVLDMDRESLLVLGGLPGGGAASSGELLRRFRREDGTQIDAAIADAPGGGSNPAPQPRRISACVDRNTHRLLVANRWLHERAVLELPGLVILDWRITSGSWLEDHERVVGRAGVVPAGFVRVACAEGAALVTWRGRPGTAYASHYFLELVDLESGAGRTMTGQLSSDRDPAALRAVGTQSGAWVFFSNADPRGPTLYWYAAAEDENG